MHIRPILFSVAVLAAAATLSADAGAGSLLRGCAARDLQFRQMIGEYSDAKAITPQRMQEVSNTMAHARLVCHDGFVMDGLAAYDGITNKLIYDLIAQSLAPYPVTAVIDERPVRDDKSQAKLYDQIAQSIASDPRTSAE